MKHTRLTALLSVCAAVAHLPGALMATVEFDAKVPQLQFAALELETALKETSRESLGVTLMIKADA